MVGDRPPRLGRTAKSAIQVSGRKTGRAWRAGAMLSLVLGGLPGCGAGSADGTVQPVIEDAGELPELDERSLEKTEPDADDAATQD